MISKMGEFIRLISHIMPTFGRVHSGASARKEIALDGTRGCTQRDCLLYEWIQNRNSVTLSGKWIHVFAATPNCFAAAASAFMEIEATIGDLKSIQKNWKVFLHPYHV